MSNLAQDIKSGLKGLQGAGDAIRGKALALGDELDPKGADHPDTVAAHAKNRALADKGAAEVKAADGDIGARHGAAGDAAGHATGTASTASATGTHGAGPGAGTVK